MEGMVPYVEFADSKGLLLWLVFGVGYLLSPTSYIGVFWLSVMSYTIAFVFLWRTSRLFVGRREALLVLALIPTLIFLRIYHNEVRAEDFCMPWISIGIYCTCRVLLSSRCMPTIRKCAFWLGFSMVCCLLIKWNLFFMMGGMALLVAGSSLLERRADGVVFGLFGLAVALLPFLLYFLLKGNLAAFVQEYFVNTYLITGNGEKGEWRTVVYTMLTSRNSLYNAIIASAPFVGMYAFCKRFHMSCLIFVLYLPFWLFFMFKPTWYYYFCLVMPFYIFSLVFIVDVPKRLIAKMPLAATVVFALFVYVWGIYYNVHLEYLVFTPSVEQDQWNVIEAELKTKQQPRILVSSDYGHGLLSRALPACKYWAKQNGATKEMEAERRRAVIERKPDFVIVDLTMEAHSENKLVPLLRKCGYKEVALPVAKDGAKTAKELALYSRCL